MTKSKNKNNRYPSDASSYPFVAEKRCPFCLKFHKAVVYCAQDKHRKFACPECLSVNKNRGHRESYKRRANEQPIHNEILAKAREKEEMLDRHTASCYDYRRALFGTIKPYRREGDE